MGEGGGGMMTKVNKVTKVKSHFVCSISLIVLYNNKVNHTLQCFGIETFYFFV